MAATIFMFFVLVVLDVLTQTVLIASLGATAFISFTMPNAESSKPRYLMGGYAVGILVGVTVSVLVSWVQITHGVGLERFIVISGAAIATGLAMLLMVATDTEHPPAAAVALKEAYKHRMLNLL
jgi:CBS-domain-containing membrane protein